jgi:hypothetical protein
MFGMFAIVFVFMLLVVLMMSIGVLFKRKPIAGSCGGASNLTGDSCTLCGYNPEDKANIKIPKEIKYKNLNHK